MGTDLGSTYQYITNQNMEDNDIWTKAFDSSCAAITVDVVGVADDVTGDASGCPPRKGSGTWNGFNPGSQASGSFPVSDWIKSEKFWRISSRELSEDPLLGEKGFRWSAEMIIGLAGLGVMIGLAGLDVMIGLAWSEVAVAVHVVPDGSRMLRSLFSSLRAVDVDVGGSPTSFLTIEPGISFIVKLFLCHLLLAL